MRFSLEQLQVFVSAVQAGSFSAAARRLGRTQSTVSAAISNLETDLGVQLFDRASRIPTLTAAGHKLLLRAEGILERCYALEGSADSLAGQVEAALTLAIEVPYGPLMAPFRGFDEAFPFVDLTIRHPLHGDVSEIIMAGEADLGVSFAQPGYPPELVFQQLGKLIMTHVCHPQFALARQGPVSFADLNAHPRLAVFAHADKLQCEMALAIFSPGDSLESFIADVATLKLIAKVPCLLAVVNEGGMNQVAEAKAELAADDILYLPLPPDEAG